MRDTVLNLKKFGVAYGEKVILTSVDLPIVTPGVTNLLGPAGTGKSTLLRTLSGINNASPSFRSWGEAEYAGEQLGKMEYPSLVAQNARLMMATVLENVIHELPERNNLTRKQQVDVATRMLHEAGLADLISQLEKNVVELPLDVQRHVSILRTVAANPKLLLIDEPTTGIQEYQSLLNYIKSLSQRRAVLIVLHHQGQVKQLGGRTALIAGGWVHELRDTEEFFQSPRSQAAKEFVHSGSCCVPSPDTKPEDIDENFINTATAPPEPVQARNYVSDAFGPRNFLWLLKGVLAGTPRPGLFVDLDYDLKALKRVGITVLVSFTTKPIPENKLTQHGISGISFPIQDMGVPSIESAMQLCGQIEDLIQQGDAIALHCKAGLGRTGTMLAAQLIWRGYKALDALEETRKIEPRWIQSEAQVDFLSQFAAAIDHSDGKLADIG